MSTSPQTGSTEKAVGDQGNKSHVTQPTQPPSPSPKQISQSLQNLRLQDAGTTNDRRAGSAGATNDKRAGSAETTNDKRAGSAETTNEKRAGSADTVAHRQGEAGDRKPPRHRRCHSQSVVPSSAQQGLTVPSPSANYVRSYSASEQGSEGTPLVIRDEAVSVEEVFGGRGQRSEGSLPRLVLVSSRVRNISVLRHAVLPGVTTLQFNYDLHTLEDILVSVAQSLCGRQVHSVAFILSCPGPTIQLTASDDKALSCDMVLDKGVLDFLTLLLDQHCNKEAPSGLRFDFLACAGVPKEEAGILALELESKLGITVGIWRDLNGVDSGGKKGEEPSVPHMCVGELYFRLEKLRSWSGQHQQSLAGFEKIRTVGKGAYGAAVLYKKKDDDSLVILKEINMHDLTAAERQLALNEVKVLALLDHPNIISYFDSFEEDGVLMIEMEYADGGTLAQYLSQQEGVVGADREREVLVMFQQILAAIRHIHQHNILHRDLKTDNIFLTKEGVVKVGDFGISKMLGSANKGALTVLGTPYYISPEMCEGKAYSYKSDIWALGCVLYEMACLQKTFEGTNLPALVNKIMQGQFAPVKGNFSPEFRELVSDMLQRDPDLRPSASDMYPRLSQLLSKFEDPASDPEEELMTSAESISRKVKVRSVLYYLESSTGTMTCITGLPPRMKIKQVGVSPDHVVVVTTERQVYSWGRGDKGQLGHGDTQGRPSPCLVEALKGKSITMACCGEDFTVLGSDNGLVLTCGGGASGCLGHGDWAAALKPRLIEALLSVDVVAMACGPHHVVVGGREGDVYSWGQGDKGQLGLGTEEHHCQPVKVGLEVGVVVQDVACGRDGTMLITDMGGVFACGSNDSNKLGLNNRQGFLMAMKNIFTKTEVEGTNVPSPVRALARHRVVSAAMGHHHSAVIVEAGHVYTFGRNTEGQLGTGNIKTFHAPVELKSLSDVSINRVQCGEHYTIASSRDHQLFYWGLRYTAALPPRSGDDPNTSLITTTTTTTDDGSSRSSISSLPVAEPDEGLGEGKEEITPRNLPPAAEGSGVGSGSESVEAANSDSAHHKQRTDTDGAKPSSASCSHRGDSGVSMTTAGSGGGTEVRGTPTTPTTAAATTPAMNESAAGFRPLSDTVSRRTFSAGSRDNGKEKEADKDRDSVKDDSVILFDPVEIIRIKQGHEKVLLGNMFCHGENLFIQVETTAPPPRRRTFKKRSFRRRPQPVDLNSNPKQMSTSSHEAGDEYSSEASEIDSRSTVPTWLREELSANSEEAPLCQDNDDDGNDADDTSDVSDDDTHCRAVIDSSMSSIHINHVLTPVKTGDGGLTPRSLQSFVPRSQHAMASTRLRTSSVNSSESNPDRASAEHLSDSSSSEAALVKSARGHPDSQHRSQIHVAVATTVKGKVSNSKVTPRIRSAGRGKSRSHEEVLKERLTARGFVSDVTVKRREEALLCELEVMREEKRQAECQLQLLQKEREQQEQLLRQEAEKLARARELQLVAEVERLRQELQDQSSQLAERQRLVGYLQKQLQQQTAQPDQSVIQSAGSKVTGPSLPSVPRLDLPAAASPPSSSSPSSRRGDVSTRNTSSSSKVCSVQ